MQILNTTESLILYVCLSIILIKIYDNEINKKVVLFPLMYIALFYFAITIDYYIFVISYPAQTLLNVLFLKISFRKDKISRIIFIYILLFSLNTIFTSVFMILIPIHMYFIECVIYILTLISCCIISFSKFKIPFKQTINCMPKLFKTVILFLLLVLAIINSLIYGFYDDLKNENWLLMTQITTMLMVISVFFLLPIIINHAVKNQQLKQLTENYENQIKTQAKHYEAVAKSNWEIRRFQHDSKNLTVGLTQLLEKGQRHEALEMLGSYYESSLGIKDKLLQFDTGNGIVDALLAEKQQTASTINTEIHFEGVVPATGILPPDLCVLFGNTLDNAVDACAKFPIEDTKIITIVSKSMGGYLWLKIQNPVVENVEIRNNTISTTKEDKTLHGFGLYSLQQVVKKHNGELKLTCENNVFETSIELNIEI